MPISCGGKRPQARPLRLGGLLPPGIWARAGAPRQPTRMLGRAGEVFARKVAKKYTFRYRSSP
jgi:hypothetical protein